MAEGQLVSSLVVLFHYLTFQKEWLSFKFNIYIYPHTKLTLPYTLQNFKYAWPKGKIVFVAISFCRTLVKVSARSQRGNRDLGEISVILGVIIRGLKISARSRRDCGCLSYLGEISVILGRDF